MKNVIKKIYVYIFLNVLLIALIYVSDISNLPNSVILFEGEKLSLRTVYGVNISTAFSSNPNIERINNNESLTVASTSIGEDLTGTVKLDVSLLGIKLKEIDVKIIEDAEVIPLGNLTGIKLYTNGVLVVGMSEIMGQDMNRYKPYEGSGIEVGDIIVEIDGELITCTSDLTDSINDSKEEEMSVTYLRDGNKQNTKLKAVKSDDNSYKIGLWVRDTAAGVGTATFYEEDSNKFASLGHGIVDTDTKELIEISSGEIVNAEILSIVKGKEGIPRENPRLNRRSEKL